MVLSNIALGINPCYFITMNSSWWILLFAGLLEVGWAIGLKYSQGFTRLIPSLLTVIAMIVSLFLLGKATQNIPIGTAYGVWVGIGSVGAAILGIYLFQEPVSPARLFFLVLLIVSIVGLKITAAA